MYIPWTCLMGNSKPQTAILGYVFSCLCFLRGSCNDCQAPMLKWVGSNWKMNFERPWCICTGFEAAKMDQNPEMYPFWVVFEENSPPNLSNSSKFHQIHQKSVFFWKNRWPKKPIKLSFFIGFLSVFYRFIGFSSFWKKWKKWKKMKKWKNPIGLYNTIWKSEIYRWRVDYYVYFYKNRTQSEKHLISPTS